MIAYSRLTVLATLVMALLASGAVRAGAQNPSSAEASQAQPAPRERSNGAVDVGRDSVHIRLLEVELRVAVQALAPYLDRPVMVEASVSAAGQSARLTLETPRPIPRSDVPRLLRGIVTGQGFDFVLDTAAGLYRVRAREQATSSSSRSAAGQSGAAGGTLSPELFVIRLRHARASEVAATVNALYGRASALGELGSRGAGPTLGQQLSTGAIPPQGGSVQGAPTQIGSQPVAGAVPSVAGRVAQFSGEVTIVPDANSNAILVRGGRSDFELVRAAVQELDVRPLQVLIEVIIAEVRTDRSFSFGVEAAVPEHAVRGLPGVTVEATQKGIGLGDFALRVMRSGSGVDFEATLRASAARGEARIVSRPVVLASNGEPAEILVGSQRPFIQVQRSLPTDTPQRDQVVQYRDVGTRLIVRPTISADGYVSIGLTQEVNAATNETQFDAPVISTRTVQTVLLVRDSQTVVLGGLSDRQREASQSGVPLLSAIPILGGLFGRASRQTMETEFFLFLTPRIIRTDEEADAATERYGGRAGVQVP